MKPIRKKTNALNNFFQAQAQLSDDNKKIPKTFLNANSPQLSTINITPSESDAPRLLKIGKATGPDAINNSVLREAAIELSVPLCTLFNFSLDKGEVPTQWKLAHVCPMFKNMTLKMCVIIDLSLSSVLSTKVLDASYISISSTLTLIFFCPFQSGFIPKDSTNVYLSLFL
jgi:hypothetical protein